MQHLDTDVLKTKRRRLKLLEDQAALKGINADPQVLMEIEDLRDEIAQAEDSLRGSVPPLLPFLPDCSPQEDCINDLLEITADESPRPIVLIIHGDEQQAHDMFAVRLAERTLPECLGLDTLSSRLTAYALEWPNPGAPLKSLDRQMASILKRTLTINRGQEPSGAIAGHPGPVFLHTHLLTENWAKHGIVAIQEFLAYWNRWPPLRSGQKLFIGVFIKYQGRPSSQANRQMRDALAQEQERQEQGGLGRLWDYDRLCGAILPQLEGVTRSEAEHWARSSRDLRLFCAGSLNTLQAGIAAIYNDWTSANKLDDGGDEPVRIPMGALSDRLVDLLVMCATRSPGRGSYELPILQRHTTS